VKLSYGGKRGNQNFEPRGQRTGYDAMRSPQRGGLELWDKLDSIGQFSRECLGKKNALP